MEDGSINFWNFVLIFLYVSFFGVLLDLFLLFYIKMSITHTQISVKNGCNIYFLSFVRRDERENYWAMAVSNTTGEADS
jgi:hypothetical protein